MEEEGAAWAAVVAADAREGQPVNHDEAHSVRDDATIPSARPNPVVRFIKWWVSLFILAGPLSVCPFCGQPGCGGSVAGASVLGALGAAFVAMPKWLVRRWKRDPKRTES